MERLISPAILVCVLTVSSGCGSPQDPVVAPPSPAAEPAPADPTAEPGAVEPGGRRRHTVDVDGHPITVWAKAPGNPRGSFVLVHGRTWSAVPDFDLQVDDEQRSLMDALSARGYRTFAVDLRGYGGTPRDDTGWLTPDRAARDLSAVIEWVTGHTGGQAPVLLGWSFGSLVAQLVAQRNPTSISRLVLFGYPRKARWSVDARPDSEQPPKRPTTREAAAEDFITSGTISERAIEAYVEAAVASDPVRADWAKIHEFNELDPGKVTTPTLVIHGERDPYAPTANQLELVEGLSATRKQHAPLPGLDHAAHLEDPVKFVETVLGFVEAD